MRLRSLASLVAATGLVAWLVLGCGGGSSPTEPVPPTPTPAPALATLSGVVTTSGTSSPVTGAVVTCQGQSSTTGTDGHYSLGSLAVGSATVQASRSGYDPYSQTTMLAPGANTLNIPLSQSTSGTSVTGTVTGLYAVDGTTPLLPGALVTIAGKTDTTDATGHFQLPTIPEGNQLVTVSLPGWLPYSQSFFISSTNRNLSLSLTYAGPDLHSIGAIGLGFRANRSCCNHQSAWFQPTFLPLTTPLHAGQPVTITFAFTIGTLYKGSTPGSSTGIRRATPGTRCTADCTRSFTEGGTVTLAQNVTSLTTLEPHGSWFCSVNGYCAYGVITSFNYVNQCGLFGDIPLSDLTVVVDGTLTATASSGDVNRWTHDTIPVHATMNAAAGPDDPSFGCW